MRSKRRRRKEGSSKNTYPCYGSYYKTDFPEQAYSLCREFGATMEQLSKYFNVSIKTVEYWYRHKQDFRKAVQRGRDLYDCKNVEASLLQRALGYDRPFQQVKKYSRQQLDKEGNVVTLENEHIVEGSTHIPPEVKACIHWLANRHPKRWSKHLLGAIKRHAHAHRHQIDLSNLSDKELFLLRDLSERINDNNGNGNKYAEIQEAEIVNNTKH